MNKGKRKILTNVSYFYFSMGVDVMLLPKLAAEDDPSELRRKVLLFLFI